MSSQKEREKERKNKERKITRQHVHSFLQLHPLLLRMHVNLSLKGIKEQKHLNLAYLMTAEYIQHINFSRTLDWGSFPKPSECLDTGRDSAMVC